MEFFRYLHSLMSRSLAIRLYGKSYRCILENMGDPQPTVMDGSEVNDIGVVPSFTHWDTGAYTVVFPKALNLLTTEVRVATLTLGSARTWSYTVVDDTTIQLAFFDNGSPADVGRIHLSVNCIEQRS